jgi:hypothetical protein
MTNERKLSTSDIAASDERRVERDRIERDRAEALDRERADRSDAPVQQVMDDRPSALFADDELNGYRTRWSAIQTGFVDEPRRAVEEADTLVAELMKRLAEGFAEERRQLESQWERADRISTEDLRLAMRRYRSFFERLLSV